MSPDTLRDLASVEYKLRGAFPWQLEILNKMSLISVVVGPLTPPRAPRSLGPQLRATAGTGHFPGNSVSTGSAAHP